MKNKRVGIVELWRFFFCLSVLFFHIFIKLEKEYFRAGYLGVEFFFVLSGFGIGTYYFSRMRGKKAGERLAELGRYIGKRLIQLYPFYFLALLLMLLLKAFSLQWSLGDTAAYLKTEYAEFLLLQCGPLGGEVLISADWYIPAVFWSGIILLLLLLLTGKFGGLFLCPLISLGIYGYYFWLIEKIDVIFSYHAILRGIAGTALGIFVCFLIRLLREKHCEREVPGILRSVMCVAANVLLSAVFVYTNFGRRCFVDFIVIGIYGVSLFFLLAAAPVFSERTEKVFRFLGKTTYPIYIFHMPVIEALLLLF